MSAHLTKEKITLQQNALAWSMLRRVGNAATNFVIESNGTRRHQVQKLNNDDLDKLVLDFTRDPKESLAWARESLFAIYADGRLSESERADRLRRYFDAYTDLNIKLDHEAFPPTVSGKVNQGVPEYIPDGFVDMGGDSSVDARIRSREQIVVDKSAILDKYKPFLIDIFSTDYSNVTLEDKKKKIITKIALEVYKSMPYDYAEANGDKDLGGDKVDLSKLNEGVCRHQCLVFQVLCQTLGIKSRLLKSYMDGDRHATNAIRIDGVWFIMDVTNPDYITKENGKREWRPGAYKVGSFPGVAGKTHKVKARYSGKEHVYAMHGDMYWRIDAHKEH